MVDLPLALHIPDGFLSGSVRSLHYPEEPESPESNDERRLLADS